jgi:hypothetical protein
MSVIKIRQALETALASIVPSIDTQYENLPYSPKANVPYQSAYLIMNTPENPTVCDSFHRERGIFQVTLRYPLLAGTIASAVQAEKIATLFRRSSVFYKDNIRVVSDKTPYIRVMPNELDRFVTVVKIYFYSDIHS